MSCPIGLGVTAERGQGLGRSALAHRLTELNNATFDLARVRVLLAVREANLRQSECGCRSVGQEQVGAEADPLSNGVLEQSVRDGNGRAEQVAP